MVSANQLYSVINSSNGQVRKVHIPIDNKKVQTTLYVPTHSTLGEKLPGVEGFAEPAIVRKANERSCWGSPVLQVTGTPRENMQKLAGMIPADSALIPKWHVLNPDGVKNVVIKDYLR